MSDSYVQRSRLPEATIWDKQPERRPVEFALEVTARCNNNCRHCYINLPAGDRQARAKELSVDEIGAIADQAVSLGAMWCLVTGGEPLLRADFPDIYMMLKRKGLLVEVFTNVTLVTKEHVQLFLEYPPRDVEVTVYGATEQTYEAVTRKPGSFAAFIRGLNLLLDNGVKVRYKAMALRSNVHELPEIGRFCRERTKDYFRFDPWLHGRFDGDPRRNEEIRSERLSPEEFVAAEQSDSERHDGLRKACKDMLIDNPEAHDDHGLCNHLFHCGAGNGEFAVSCDGIFRLCPSLWHPDCIYDLRRGTLENAYYTHAPKVLQKRTNSKEFMDRCRRCKLVNFCLWCPAHSHLETGKLDTPVDYFCEVAHARARMLNLDSGCVSP